MERSESMHFLIILFKALKKSLSNGLPATFSLVRENKTAGASDFVSGLEKAVLCSLASQAGKRVLRRD